VLLSIPVVKLCYFIAALYAEEIVNSGLGRSVSVIIKRVYAVLLTTVNIDMFTY